MQSTSRGSNICFPRHHPDPLILWPELPFLRLTPEQKQYLQLYDLLSQVDTLITLFKQWPPSMA